MTINRHIQRTMLYLVIFGYSPFINAQTSDRSLNNENNSSRTIYHWEAEAIEFPSEMLIYKTLEPYVTLEHVDQLLNTLGINAPVETTEDNYFVNNDSQTIESSRKRNTGYFRYTDNERISIQKPAENLPTEEIAIRRARQLLEEHDLMPPANPTPNPGFIQYGIIDNEGNWVEQGNTALVIGFSFDIDGIRFIGPGAKAGVVFGENGDVIAVSRIWRNIEKGHISPIQSIDSAKYRFKNYWPLEYLDDAHPQEYDVLTDVIIEDIYLAYYTKPGTIEQPFIEPVYVFEGQYKVRSTAEDPQIFDNDTFLILIPAMKE